MINRNATNDMETSLNEKLHLEKVFCGNNQMAVALRHHDWESSVLGPVSGWPEALKTSIRIILTSAYPMFVWWGEEMIMFYNDAYIPGLGSKHPESIGQSGKESWKEVWPIIGPLMEKVLSEGEACYREKDLLYTERNYFKEETYYTYSYSPVYMEDGTVGGVFCACHEETKQVLSERRISTVTNISSIRADLAVEAARAKVINILSDNPQDLPFAILYTKEENRLKVNRYTSSAFNGEIEKVLDSWAPSVALENEDENESFRPVAIPPQIKKLLKVPHHGVIPEQIVTIPVKDSSYNQIRGYLILGISAVLPYNEEYENFLRLLSSQVNAIVTSIWTFEQERQLSKKLLELNSAKNDFLSNVSHEFRTPLALILGPLEDLLDNSGTLSVSDKESLQIMQRNGLRLLKQVNNLLNYSFVEAGRYRAKFVPTDIAKTTLELSSTFRSVMAQAALEYRITCDPISEPVYVDADMWEMIVLNLLSNAYKFTLSGSIELGLVEKEAAVELYVADTGIGIPEKDLPHLFERFNRVVHTAGRSSEGAGIGLALVFELVRLHGGSIAVTSEEHKGSCFRVTIPKGSSHLPQDQVSDMISERGATTLREMHKSEAETWLIPGKENEDYGPLLTAPEISSQKPIVLVVDDNPDMLSYLSSLLEIDYQILKASNGQEALRVLQDTVPNLILTDIMMPVLDGVSLLNKVRSIPKLISVPVILLTARAGAEDKSLGLNKGANDYLVKPFSTNELLTRVHAQIRNAQLRNEWKDKEQALLAETAERKKLLESILNSISDGFFHVNSNLEFIYVNNRALQLTNRTEEEHLGRKILDVYPYLIDSALYQKVLNALETMQPVAFEYYDNALERWFDARLYPISTGITGYFADVTDRKLEEQARIESENRFSVIANAAPVLIWMAGKDMLCNFFNNEWLAFRGRKLEEELGDGWLEGVHPDDVESCMRTYTNAFNSAIPFSMEYRLLNKDGQYRWLLDNGSPRLTGEGQLLGYIGACTDITERKWAESVLENYNRELVAQVDARTHELRVANKQLQLLTSHLQDLRENERKLIACEIHDDLGQALSALKIEIALLHGRVNDSRSKYKAAMLEDLKSMERALDTSLAAMRRIISELRPSLSDDLELVHELQKLVNDLRKRLGISLDLDSEVESITLEPSVAIEVFRVIQESVTNIIKHANASFASIKITRQHGRLKFLVTDNGVGFVPKSAGKHSFGLLGIKERAQRIGGNLSIHTAPGKGTIVELTVSDSSTNQQQHD